MVTEFLQVKNRASSIITVAINNSDNPVTFTVTTGEGAKFPDTSLGHFDVTIDDEILHCTSRTTDTLICTRAQQNTVIASHLINTAISLNWTERIVQDLNSAVNALENSGASFGVNIDGGTSPIILGFKGFVTIPYACTITGWYIVGYPAGSIIIDVWKASGSMPTVANRIAGTERPYLSSAAVNSDTNLTTWTDKNISAGDIIAFNVDSVLGCKKISLVIKVTK